MAIVVTGYVRVGHRKKKGMRRFKKETITLPEGVAVASGLLVYLKEGPLYVDFVAVEAGEVGIEENGRISLYFRKLTFSGSKQRDYFIKVLKHYHWKEG